jgi:hypothetical protein
VLAVGVPYSGQLQEAGAPVNGTRTITLSIFDSLSDGTLLHTQTEALPVTNGYFHTSLNAPNEVWNGSDRYVEVRVNGGFPLPPRIRIGWVPYAVHSLGPTKTNQLVESYWSSTSRMVSSVTWVRLDSLQIDSPNGGIAMLTHTGSITATSPQNSLYPILLAIGKTPPDGVLGDTSAYPLHSGGKAPMNFTVARSLSPGLNKLYLYAHVLLTGNEYEVQTMNFQAVHLPN